MVVVPVMLRRMVDLGEEAFKDRDLSELRIIFVSGSALGVDLTKRATELFGPVIYNLYGSTEVAYATIATPEDQKADPASVGKVVRGSVVKIFDDDGNEVPAGESGRIFVGNLSQFEGYTGGDSKESVGGLISSGDVGHFDDEGRLFIDGRDDEMIVSGGENVFPAEIEELLSGHEKIEEAAAVGVEDEQFGQRLKAYVVLRGGSEADRGRDQGVREGQPRQLQGPAGRGLPRRASAQPDRQGSEGRARGDGGGRGLSGPRQEAQSPPPRVLRRVGVLLESPVEERVWGAGVDVDLMVDSRLAEQPLETADLLDRDRLVLLAEQPEHRAADVGGAVERRGHLVARRVERAVEADHRREPELGAR